MIFINKETKEKYYLTANCITCVVLQNIETGNTETIETEIFDNSFIKYNDKDVSSESEKN